MAELIHFGTTLVQERKTLADVLALCFAALVRVFVSTYAAYLNAALLATRLFAACLPRLRYWLRPPARRVRWAGSLMGTPLRRNLRSLKIDIASPPKLNLDPDNPFEDYHTETGIRPRPFLPRVPARHAPPLAGDTAATSARAA